MRTAEKIQAVINTLNTVSVCGVDNLNHLLGCIQTLVDVKKELNTQEANAHYENASEH